MENETRILGLTMLVAARIVRGEDLPVGSGLDGTMQQANTMLNSIAEWAEKNSEQKKR